MVLHHVGRELRKFVHFLMAHVHVASWTVRQILVYLNIDLLVNYWGCAPPVSGYSVYHVSLSTVQPGCQAQLYCFRLIHLSDRDAFVRSTSSCFITEAKPIPCESPQWHVMAYCTQVYYAIVFPPDITWHGLLTFFWNLEIFNSKNLPDRTINAICNSCGSSESSIVLRSIISPDVPSKHRSLLFFRKFEINYK